MNEKTAKMLRTFSEATNLDYRKLRVRWDNLPRDQKASDSKSMKRVIKPYKEQKAKAKEAERAAYKAAKAKEKEDD